MTWSTVEDLEDWTQLTLIQLGLFVRDLRHSKSLTQQRLSERCGLSQSAISRLENGRAPGLRLAWYARALVGLQDDIGIAGQWRRRWTEEARQRLIDDFGPGGWLDQQLITSEVARQDVIAEVAQR